MNYDAKGLASALQSTARVSWTCVHMWRLRSENGYEIQVRFSEILVWTVRSEFMKLWRHSGAGAGKSVGHRAKSLDEHGQFIIYNPPFTVCRSSQDSRLKGCVFSPMLLLILFFSLFKKLIMKRSFYIKHGQGCVLSRRLVHINLRTLIFISPVRKYLRFSIRRIRSHVFWQLFLRCVK